MRLVLLLVIAAGCSHRPLPLPDPVADAGVRDLATPDLSNAPDLSSAPDLSAPDLATPDLSTAPDLSTVPDLARAGFVALTTESRPINPYRVAAGDFDGDGRADAVTVELSGPTISFHRGRGDGTLESGRPQPLGPPTWTEPPEVATGDLDGDGRLDVVATTTAGIFVYYGNANGLLPGENLKTTDYFYAVGIAQVDGDGHLDIVAQGRRRLVWLSKAGGGFAAPRFLPADGGAFAVGDLDGDGDADLVTNSPVRVFIGLGDGSFVEGPRVPEADPLGPALIDGRLTLADLDGDGALDLLHPARILYGNGDGSFRATTTPGLYGLIAVGDFDSDGKRDFAAAGSLASEFLTLPIRFAADGFATVAAVKSGCRYMKGVASADFNGDGAADLVVACASSVSVMLNNHTRQLGTPLVGGAGAPVGVVAGDLDGDGRVDLAIGQAEGAVTLRRGRGDGTFDPDREVWIDVTRSLQGLAAGDFDEDGDLDLVTFHYPGPMYLLRNRGDGSFDIEGYNGAGWRAIAIADFDGDRHLDLISANDTLFFVKGRGDAGFANRIVLGTGGMPGAAGDFDRDGHLDFSYATVDAVTVRRGRGDGSFDAPRELAATHSPFALAAADLDGDGALNLIAVDLDAGTLGTWRGRGDGSFHARVDTAVAPKKLSTLRAADFDSDGVVDIVVGSRNPVGIFFLRGRGDGTLAPPVPYSAGDGGIVDELATGDLDGDGRLDLVGISGQNNSTTVLLNRF